MKAYVLPASSDLIAAVAQRLVSAGDDYSSNLVVFPGRRPAHFLRKRIAGTHGTSFIPPRIFSMDDLIDFICEERLGSSARKIDGIDAVAILYELHRKAPKQLGGRGFLSPDSFYPIGLKIYRDLEELTIEGVGVKDVKSVDSLIHDGIPPGSADRLQTVSYFYEHFYEEIRKQELSTRSLRYALAADEADRAGLTGFARIIIAGFFALTRIEERLLKKLAGYEGTFFYVHDGPGIRERLDALGLECEVLPGERPAAPAVSFLQSPDAHGQAFALNRIIGEAADSGDMPDERTVIVLPSADSLFPVLHHGIPMLPRESFNVSMGYPLSRTPIFGFFGNLSQLMLSMEGDRLYLPDYLKFVLHPYVKNILFRGRADVTRIVFHTMEDEMTRIRTRTFLGLDEIEQDREMIRKIHERVAPVDTGVSAGDLGNHIREIHDSLIRKFLAVRSLHDFASRAMEVMQYIYENSTARLHPFFYPFSEAFMESMQAITRSLMKDTAFDELVSYFHFFRKFLMTGHVPFTGTPVKGLQVLGFLETRNIPFERVFVLDMNEDVMPATDRDESLLPFGVRMALGLPTYLERDMISAYYFHTLTQAAREVHLFFIDSARKEKSRFVERLLWDQQKKEKEIKPDNYVRSVFYEVKLDSRVPEPLMKSPEVASFLRHFEYSPSSLDTYLSCPLQFHYRYVLKISGREEITGEIERADTGKFVHRVLHDFFRNKEGRPLTSADLDVSVMERTVDEHFRNIYDLEPAGSLYLLKRQIQKHLRDFLAVYQTEVLKAGPVTILELESDLKITMDSFTIKGRLDRIEQRGDRICIIDYKTQASDRSLRVRFERLDPDVPESRHDAIGSLQLPLYMLLWSEARKTPVDQISPMCLLLGKIRLDSGIEAPLFSGGDDARKQFMRLKAVIGNMLKEIADPEKPFLPAFDMKNTCPYCDFRYICGTQWIVGRR